MKLWFDSPTPQDFLHDKANSKDQVVATMREAPFATNLVTGEIIANDVKCATRTLKDLQGVFRDESARQSMDPNARVYRVQTLYPVSEGEEGGLFWGTTFLEPGLVGDEYFMTKGHYHANRNRGEFYLTLRGNGALILMDEHRRTVFEPMRPGTLHYVRARTAHRVANTGDSLLTFLACWPSDAGHDYATIVREGFSARLRKVEGVPTLVEEK